MNLRLFIFNLFFSLVEWHMTTRNVESIAVNETSAWYLCDGLVYVQNGLTHTKPFNENPVEIDCICKMSKLACFDNVSG